MSRRRKTAGILALAATTALGPAGGVAWAHGPTTREDVPPIPDWLFLVGAVAVLAISFVWANRQKDWGDPDRTVRRTVTLPSEPVRVAAQVAGGLLGVLLLGVIIWSGLSGTRIVTENLVPTFVFVAFWVFLGTLSALAGNVFAIVNPWRALGRGTGWLAARVGLAAAPMAYPRRIGMWPAALTLLAFSWLEVSPNGGFPRNLTIGAIIYTTVTLMGMGFYGVKAWCANAEGFGVAFRIFSRLAPVDWHGDRVDLRRPVVGLRTMDLPPGGIAVLVVLIAGVSFDGLTAGATWQRFAQSLLDPVESIGFPSGTAIELIYLAGLLVAVAVIAGLYRLGAAATAAAARMDAGAAERLLVCSLVPIAFAYFVAHNLGALILQIQAVPALLSDPLGHGDNYLGTAGWAVNYQFLSPEFFWYSQVVLVTVGHVVAMWVGHAQIATLGLTEDVLRRAQTRLFGVMVVFTVLALWLLSEASKE